MDQDDIVNDTIRLFTETKDIFLVDVNDNDETNDEKLIEESEEIMNSSEKLLLMSKLVYIELVKISGDETQDDRTDLLNRQLHKNCNQLLKNVNLVKDKLCMITNKAKARYLHSKLIFSIDIINEILVILDV